MDQEQRTKQREEGHNAPGCFMCLNVGPFLRNLWSEGTRDHFRNSRIEFLKEIGRASWRERV